MGKPMPKRRADCHPDRPHRARGMCNACYQSFKLTPEFDRRGRVRTINTCGHLDRRHVGHGKCPACYARHLRETDPKYCKESRKDEEMRRRYGIGTTERDRIIHEQGGECAICRRRFDEKRKPHIDHCHEDGYIRGVLCFTCNKALGMFGDNEAGIERVLDYFHRPSKWYQPNRPVDWW